MRVIAILLMLCFSGCGNQIDEDKIIEIVERNMQPQMSAYKSELITIIQKLQIKQNLLIEYLNLSFRTVPGEPEMMVIERDEDAYTTFISRYDSNPDTTCDLDAVATLCGVGVFEGDKLGEK